MQNARHVLAFTKRALNSCMQINLQANNYSRAARRQKALFEAMRAQRNPHFLFIACAFSPPF